MISKKLIRGLERHMITSTRFNPTMNGTLHLGHIFAFLVNEYHAHSRNGRFYVRFDDDNSIINKQPKEETDYIIKSQLEDIYWLEVKVEGFISQKEILPEVRNKLDDLGYESIPEIELGNHKYPYFIQMGTRWIAYPYVCQQTAERVIMDSMLETTHVIRGIEFSTEYSLYCYFCQKFHVPIPEFIFLPRLEGIYGDISKTSGGYKIADFRNEGYTAQQLKQMIAKACLYYPNNGYELYNIKPNPRINM
jgi:glutamyl/glutaminyl-tRNA synthetase